MQSDDPVGLPPSEGFVQDERLRLAIAAARIGTWDFHPQAGEFRWDARCKALFGLGPGVEVDYGVFIAGIHPSDREVTDRAIQAALRGENDGRYEIEFRTLGLSDGVERWLSSNGRTFFDEQGRAVRFIGTVLDITERKRAEETTAFLSQASEILASSLDCADTLTRAAERAVPHLGEWCLVDLLEEDGGIRRLAVAHASPELAELVPHTRVFNLGTRASPSRHGRSLLEGRSVLEETLDDAWMERSAQTADRLEAMHAVGARTLMAVPLVARGQVLGALTFLGVALGRQFSRADLTVAEGLAHRAALAVDNARLYGKAQSAIAARDEFLSVASHELKTPLTPLALKLDSLARTSASQDGLFLGGRVRSDIHLMRRQVRRLAGLIDELLDVSRITSGKLHILPEPVDLGALLRDVVTRFEPEAERIHSEVELEVVRNATGQWDRLRLEQVVENLLANALKYGGGEPVRVIADVSEGQAVISVEDHGIGIAPDALDRIFGRFERAVSERHYGGLGLGLYVARQIVGAMDGTISVTSRPGEGATFTVELPLDAGPE